MKVTSDIARNQKGMRKSNQVLKYGFQTLVGATRPVDEEFPRIFPVPLPEDDDEDDGNLLRSLF